jgi:hypothetical protein
VRLEGCYEPEVKGFAVQCRAHRLDGAAINPPAVAQESAIPNFMSTDSGWLLASGINFQPIAGEILPIGADPTFRRGAIGNGQVAIERIAMPRTGT